MDFAFAWRHLPENLDPVVLRLGPLAVRWYGLLYVAAFGAVYALVRRRLRKEDTGFSLDLVENFFIWMFCGVVLGARVGYALFYDFRHFLAYPLELIWPFADGRFTGISGMSYHGGALGLALATWIFAAKNRVDLWKLCDLFVPAVPLGYTLGRIGNFLNGELYGRVTEKSWGMFFPEDPSHALRHPSQLYEAFFEGIFLFAVLWPLRKWDFPKGTLAGLYLIGYGAVRFFIEFTREPDRQLGFVFGSLSMGQILCFAMVAAGLSVLATAPLRARDK